MASLAEQAYQQLRQQIVRLDFRPGQVLREDDVCSRLGIGRTPVREALQRLARDQFIHVLPRKGMVITGVDASELSLLFETRSVLEPFAARLAATRGTQRDWEAMAAVLETAAATSAGPALLDLDRQCHELLWAAANNRFLVDTLDVLYAQSARLWHLYLSDGVDMTSALDEHGHILEALREGDGERAAALAEHHVRSFDAEIRAIITSPGSSSPQVSN
jgi:DNA-binding GntR family transcriptional regulator